MIHIEQEGIAVDNRIRLRNIYRICPEKMVIVDIVTKTDSGIPDSYFIGAGLVDLVPHPGVRELIAHTIKKVSLTGDTQIGLFPVKVPGGEETRFIRFDRDKDGFVLAHT